MIDTEKLIQDILFGIEATSGKDDYSIGMRNGMRWVLSMITNEEPKFENGRKNESNSNLGENRMLTTNQKDILAFLCIVQWLTGHSCASVESITKAYEKARKVIEENEIKEANISKTKQINENRGETE